MVLLVQPRFHNSKTNVSNQSQRRGESHKNIFFNICKAFSIQFEPYGHLKVVLALHYDDINVLHSKRKHVGISDVLCWFARCRVCKFRHFNCMTLWLVHRYIGHPCCDSIHEQCDGDMLEYAQVLMFLHSSCLRLIIFDSTCLCFCIRVSGVYIWCTVCVIAMDI